jgi:hypothetical protein
MIFEPKSAGLRWMQKAAIIAALLLVVGTVCVVLVLQLRPKPFVLPFTAADVASIEARRVYLGDDDVPKTFQVPPSSWNAILAALSPAHEDRDPSKWVVHGELHVKKKDGRPYFIMFSADDEFAAGPTHGERVYYRGADGLAQVVLDACGASQPKK